jgi:O-antigen/teichoic acid export membrane protein
VAALGVGVYYYLNGSILLGIAFMCSSLLLPLYNNFQTYGALFSGKQQFNKVARYQAATQVIAISATILAACLTRNLILIIIVYLAMSSLCRGYFYWRALKSRENQGMDDTLIPFGRHMTLMDIPGAIRENYDKLIIAVFLSFPEVAIYSIALGFSNLLNPLRSVIASLIFPKLAQMDRDTAYREVKKRWPLVTLGFAVLAGILIIVSPYLIPLLYSEKYVDSVWYAQLLLISVVIVAPVPIINRALLPSQKSMKDLYKLRTIEPVVAIVLLTLLVLNFGLIGAVIAIIATRVITTLYSLKLARFLSFR